MTGTAQVSQERPKDQPGLVDTEFADQLLTQGPAANPAVDEGAAQDVLADRSERRYPSIVWRTQ